MKKAVPPYMTSSEGLSSERGNGEWKARKVAKALFQAEDRALMIPAEQVWRELGLED